MQHTADRVSAIIKRFSGMAFTPKGVRTDLAVLESMPRVSQHQDALVDFQTLLH